MSEANAKPATADGESFDLEKEVEAWNWARAAGVSAQELHKALRDMIAWLVQRKGWKPAEAYVFCSLACDLHVTQLVDGNKGVHAMVARRLID